MVTKIVFTDDLIERFWAKVDCDVDDQCWKWLAGKSGEGYGQFWFNRKLVPAHRFSYVLEIGHIPEGKELHHKCENHSCVNPHHLVAVTAKEHIINLSPNNIIYKNSRKTHCSQGHEYNEENMYNYNDGRRYCKICIANRTYAYRAIRKLEKIH